jgi:hypothetical protein
MAQTAILFPRAVKSASPVGAWLARAEQARRVAAMLSPQDAAIVEAYAAECEAEATRPLDEKRPARAA